MDIKTYKKDQDIQLTPNFHLKEYNCSCNSCTETLVDLDHIKKLQAFRDFLDLPITITSAYRCNSHNKEVGGATNSFHLQGTATDIIVKGLSADLVQSTALLSFNGLGEYDTFTHIDSRTTRARWSHRTPKPILPEGPSEGDMDEILDDLEQDLL